ncbi:MAG: efflux RND transporter periplasmic adaptor subunit [Nitrospirae bacterium]|nr:efflux RND transporter periplasmic adaptor subunit [Nitrospirota bacterium]
MTHDDLSKLKINKAALSSAPHRRRKMFLPAAAIVIMVLGGISYFKGKSVEVEVVTVSQIYPSQTFTVLNASGYVVAQRKAAVASKITGRLEALMVEEGNMVKKGDIIARLENADAAAVRERAAADLEEVRHNLEQAKVELHDAALSFDRNKELFSQELITKAAYDAAETRLRKSRAAVSSAEASVKARAAALKEAEVSVEYSFIRAPFDAVVLTKNADIGDIITPLGAAANAKAAAVTIADMGSLEVEVDVSESNIGQVKAGQPCEIILDAIPDSRFRGEVHTVVPTADRTKASVLVKVRFIDKDKRILPEMSAKVAFLQRPVAPKEQQPRTVVDPASLLGRDNRKAVFLIKDDHAFETPVTIGPQIGDTVEVLSGVKAGDKVVLHPSDKLRNGDKITVLEK